MSNPIEIAEAVPSTEMFEAQETIGAVLAQMAAEYQSSGGHWPPDVMQKHTDERATLIRARNILLDRVINERQTKI